MIFFNQNNSILIAGKVVTWLINKVPPHPAHNYHLGFPHPIFPPVLLPSGLQAQDQRAQALHFCPKLPTAFLLSSSNTWGSQYQENILPCGYMGRGCNFWKVLNSSWWSQVSTDAQSYSRSWEGWEEFWKLEWQKSKLLIYRTVRSWTQGTPTTVLWAEAVSATPSEILQHPSEHWKCTCWKETN